MEQTDLCFKNSWVLKFWMTGNNFVFDLISSQYFQGRDF